MSQETVQKAVSSGADSLRKIYDLTTAGVGPCGGSCRELLKTYLAKTPSSDQDLKYPPTWNLPTEVVEAVSLFNRRYYWETHEILEDLWMVERGPLRLLYQGIIQAAASMYHVLNANPKGVVKLGAEALNKLEPYRPTYQSIKIEVLCRRLADYIEQAKEILGNTRHGFDYDRLPVILIGNDMKLGEIHQ